MKNGGPEINEQSSEEQLEETNTKLSFSKIFDKIGNKYGIFIIGIIGLSSFVAYDKHEYNKHEIALSNTVSLGYDDLIDIEGIIEGLSIETLLWSYKSFIKRSCINYDLKEEEIENIEFGQATQNSLEIKIVYDGREHFYTQAIDKNFYEKYKEHREEVEEKKINDTLLRVLDDLYKKVYEDTDSIELVISLIVRSIKDEIGKKGLDENQYEGTTLIGLGKDKLHLRVSYAGKKYDYGLKLDGKFYQKILLLRQNREKVIKDILVLARKGANNIGEMGKRFEYFLKKNPMFKEKAVLYSVSEKADVIISYKDIFGKQVLIFRNGHDFMRIF